MITTITVTVIVIIMIMIMIMIMIIMCNGVIRARTSEMPIWKSVSASGPHMQQS